MDKQRKWFLWAGHDNILGGKYKVNWTRICLPTSLGGLGVLNLENFARALRVRWLWHEWKASEKAWVGLDTRCDDSDKLLFTAESFYKAHFFGSTATNYELIVWKPWAPNKCKLFAWLIIQNKVWTSDRLEARGWPNNCDCPLCH
ncbi:hypothetical protein E2562_033941 [Oryza meyeriana var. granulata]|uniref:Reverse transcriptase zinc-binding domain-containing protein n=1 Tax=Oryza meyeriana var. granulata TaxID=110450 RepID=A0A6G1CAM2_9ORYZ|nr:hypothetical protein E2562_033941 [Oryza meyeriana var. granulata]